MPINDDTLMVKGGKHTSLTTLPTDEYEKLKDKAAKWDRVKRLVDSVPPCKECSLWETEHPGKYTCTFKVLFDLLTKKEDGDERH